MKSMGGRTNYATTLVVARADLSRGVDDRHLGHTGPAPFGSARQQAACLQRLLYDAHIMCTCTLLVAGQLRLE
jgi:hypothetical protein